MLLEGGEKATSSPISSSFPKNQILSTTDFVSFSRVTFVPAKVTKTSRTQ